MTVPRDGQEGERLTAAWNEGAGGPLTLDAALFALHIADDALGWEHPVARMIVTEALWRSTALRAPAGPGGSGG